jgi:hypothetical protein
MVKVVVLGVNTKNAPDLIKILSQEYHLKQSIDVKSVAKCSMNRNIDLWLCHTTKKLNGKQTVVSCHHNYHTEMCFETTGSATESSVASELTEE